MQGPAIFNIWGMRNQQGNLGEAIEAEGKLEEEHDAWNPHKEGVTGKRHEALTNAAGSSSKRLVMQIACS